MPLSTMLEQLYARRRFGIRPGAERVRVLLDSLGNPERTFRSIHVVGTNGKGSTSAFLASILTASGRTTGLFTSPHLLRFNERFRIDGKEADDSLIEASLENVLCHASEEATFFEIVTALGALLFAEQGVEIAVMEAGMGGRSDATAAFPGIMTIVTPISLDHCDYLGETVEQIASEKGGIIEPETPVILGHQTVGVRTFFSAHVNHISSPCMAAGEDFSAIWEENGTLTYRGRKWQLSGLTPGIPGRYQSDNAGLALAAAEQLELAGMAFSPDAPARGIASARWPGRMELVDREFRLLLDGAHNPAGAAALAVSLSEYRYQRLLLVVGLMADKDAPAILAPLLPFASACYCVTPSVERALDAGTLATMVAERGISALPCASVGEGITAALAERGPDDLVVVCGSLFTVGEAKAWLENVPFDGIRG